MDEMKGIEDIARYLFGYSLEKGDSFLKLYCKIVNINFLIEGVNDATNTSFVGSFAA